MKCPECAQGKTGNCTGWVIDTDDQVGVCESVPAKTEDGA